MSTIRRLVYLLPALAQLTLWPSLAAAGNTDVAAEVEVRQAIRDYDEALQRADVGAVEKFWASEYTFVNPRGERLTRADRMANLRSKRTNLDSLAHVPQQDERMQVYGDFALYTTLLTISGQYSGESAKGQFRALVVWVRRDGRWQQIASQMTPVLAPPVVAPK